MLHGMHGRATSTTFLALLLSATYAGGQEWTRFRGPDGNGISDATTIPVTWTDRDYNWKVKLPGVGHSSPVLWGERIFLTCGDPETARRTVLCLAAADGRILWRRDYPSKAHKMHRFNSYGTATPATDAGGVVVTWSTPEEIVLLALDLEGRETWRRDLGPLVSVHGSGSSPIIVGDLVVLANDQADLKLMARYLPKGTPIGPPGKSFLTAVDRKTGETRWEVKRRSTLVPYSTPCVRRPEGGDPELIFSSTSHGITAVDAATGKVNWEMDDLFKDRCVGSPVSGSDWVMASYGHGARGNRLAVVRPGVPSKNKEPKLAFDITKSVPLVPTPLVKDGRAFLWCDDGVVTCVDVSTGKVIWKERVGGNFYGSPVCVNNRLYCIDRAGTVVVVAASDTYEPLARVSLGELSYATPAVAGGVMYLRTHAHLYSLGGRKP